MNRMLKIPLVQARLLEADSAWPRGSNPVDSIHKLEVLMRKGKDNSGIIWLVDSIWYVVVHMGKQSDSDDFSLTGLRGKASSGNRGYADALMFKKDSIPYLLDTLPRELGLDVNWCANVARPKMDSVAAHLEANKDPTWRAGIDKPTLTCTNFVDDYLFETKYDACVKSMVKNSKQASAVTQQPGITELLADITKDVASLAKAESEDASKRDKDDDVLQREKDDSDFSCKTVNTIRAKDPKKNVEVSTSELADEFKEKIKHCQSLIKQRVDAGVALISKSPVTTANLAAALGASAAGRYIGPSNVAVIYDSKLHGEAQNRPNVRLPQCKWMT